MADKITLGGIGYALAGLTLFVTIMGAVVVWDYTSGRVDLEGPATAVVPIR
ncbi:MAG TPA: hypothetical protein VNQ56_18425 [Pseudolabrys sp.]|nr:hypothetical protein [Pseudolabrys sp.]